MRKIIFIIKCKYCNRPNKIKDHAANLRPVCGNCGEPIKKGIFYFSKKLLIKLLNLPSNIIEYISDMLPEILMVITVLFIIGGIIALAGWRSGDWFFGVFGGLIISLMIMQGIARSVGESDEFIVSLLDGLSIITMIPSTICLLIGLFKTCSRT